MRPLLAALLAAAVLPLAGCLDGKAPGPSADVAGSTPRPAPVAPLAPPTGWPHFPSDGASDVAMLEIPSFDEHQIPLTVYKPKVASAGRQVPVVLHSHGFTGERAKDPDAFRELVAAGFGVVSFDERGHGDSRDDSEVHFMHPDHEVKDVRRVIDHVATLDWALLEAPGDPLLGAIGGSYGGAYQLMGAAFDPRLDALVPEVTWNDVTEALAPGGAIKSGWVDLFYAAGNAEGSVVFSDDFHVGWAWAASTNTFPAGQAPGVPDLHARLKEASPASYPGAITVPTLLVQGMPDTLFPLNQAVANLRLLEAAGATVSLSTHLGGHVLNTASLEPRVPHPVGLQGLPGGEPCGRLVALQVAWLQRHLLGLPVDTGPRVCLALEDETAVSGDAFPLPGTTMVPFDLGGPVPVVQAPAGPGVEIPLFTAERDTVVAGIPVLRGRLTTTGADAIVYFSLKVPSRGDPFESVVDDQVTPLRMSAQVAPKEFALELGGVGTRLKAGESLVLVASTVEPMYFGNAERVPGGAVLDGLVLELPVVPSAPPAA